MPFLKMGILRLFRHGDIVMNSKNKSRNEDFYAFFSSFAGRTELVHYPDEYTAQAYDSFFKNTNLTGRIEIPASRIYISIPDEDGKPVFIEFSSSPYIHIHSEVYFVNCKRQPPKRVADRYWKSLQKVTVFPNGTIFYDRRGKYFPISLRRLVFLFDSHGVGNILDGFLLLPNIADSYVLKDLVAEYRGRTAGSFPSLLWNKCLGFKNKNHLMSFLYKDASGIDCNRFGLVAGYLFMKVRPYVDDLSQGILYNAFTHKEITEYFCSDARKKSAVAEAVLIDYLTKRFRAKNQDVYPAEISDYVSNSLAVNEKISLRWNSFRKMVQRNIDLVLMYRNKKTPKIRIPKASKFAPLDKALPKSFERIKTRERIVREGYEMRHCVASYADFVNKDVCAIYHLIYDGVDYTAEIRVRNGKYFLRQLQSKADRGAPDEAMKFVRQLIAKVTPKRS